VARQIEMQMVALVAIVRRTEHGREGVAGPSVHGAQEGAFGNGTPPARSDGNHPPIGRGESRDVDGVGMAVLGETR
jgi:hypothetical protein